MNIADFWSLYARVGDAVDPVRGNLAAGLVALAGLVLTMHGLTMPTMVEMYDSLLPRLSESLRSNPDRDHLAGLRAHSAALRRAAVVCVVGAAGLAWSRNEVAATWLLAVVLFVGWSLMRASSTFDRALGTLSELQRVEMRELLVKRDAEAATHLKQLLQKEPPAA